MKDILFDLEARLKKLFESPSKLGIEETGKSIGEIQQEAKKPEPEKVEPPKLATSTLQPPQKIYVEASPKQRTNGMLQMISNE